MENVQGFNTKVEGATPIIDRLLSDGFRKAVVVLFDDQNSDIAAVVTSLNADHVPFEGSVREIERIHALLSAKALIEETLDRMVEDSDQSKALPN